jgi:tetratricopeptide (TPR) repeat protein
LGNTRAVISARWAFAEAVECHRRGNLLQAERSCLRTLEIEPRHFAALHLLGVIALQRQAFEEAARTIERALAINPHMVAAHRHRGVALAHIGRLDEALASFKNATALEPDDAEAHGQSGTVLHRLGRFEEAIAEYDKALALTPDHAVHHNNRASSLFAIDLLDDALSACDKSIAASPVRPKAWYDRGKVLWELKRPEDALASYNRALALKSDYAPALFSRGVCKLAMAVDATAWQDFEHRWRDPSHYSLRAPADTPQWSGEDLRGRSILVCAEGGLGDVIQFSRYVPLLAERGAMVSFLVPDKLMRILAGLPRSVRLISSVEQAERFDFHGGLMSLPCRMGAAVRGIPPPLPHLATDAGSGAEWRRRIGERGFKIGIAWQGAVGKGVGPALVGRSIPLARFRALSEIDGVRLISLQKEWSVEELGMSAPGMTIESLGKDFDAGPDAFVDTVAVIGHLDLIVTCDTSIAHVAGTLGRPTWIALKHVPEWRWGLEGLATPWYPTARLFRQKSRNDWDSVFDQMAAELTQLLACRSLREH